LSLLTLYRQNLSTAYSVAAATGTAATLAVGVAAKVGVFSVVGVATVLGTGASKAITQANAFGIVSTNVVGASLNQAKLFSSGSTYGLAYSNSVAFDNLGGPIASAPILWGPIASTYISVRISNGLTGVGNSIAGSSAAGVGANALQSVGSSSSSLNGIAETNVLGAEVLARSPIAFGSTLLNNAKAVGLAATFASRSVSATGSSSSGFISPHAVTGVGSATSSASGFMPAAWAYSSFAQAIANADGTGVLQPSVFVPGYSLDAIATGNFVAIWKVAEPFICNNTSTGTFVSSAIAKSKASASGLSLGIMINYGFGIANAAGSSLGVAIPPQAIAAAIGSASVNGVGGYSYF